MVDDDSRSCPMNNSLCQPNDASTEAFASEQGKSASRLKLVPSRYFFSATDLQTVERYKTLKNTKNVLKMMKRCPAGSRG